MRKSLPYDCAGSTERKASIRRYFPPTRKRGNPGGKLLGFIAYGLYLEAKREWVSDFQAREQRYPGDEELSTYERSWTPSRLEALENAAAQLVTAYTELGGDLSRETDPPERLERKLLACRGALGSRCPVIYSLAIRTRHRFD